MTLALLILGLFAAGCVSLVFGALFGLVRLFFSMGFWVFQIVGFILGAVLFGGSVFVFLAIVLVVNLIGLPFFLLRRR